MVVEEATGAWGFGAEVVAAVTEANEAGTIRAARVAAHPLAIPNARPAEDVVLPGVQDVILAFHRVLQ